MSEIERALIRAGAVLVKNNRHRVYEHEGRIYTLSHSKGCNNRYRLRAKLKSIRGGR